MEFHAFNLKRVKNSLSIYFIVLDFCRTRIMKTDTLTNFSSLQLTWAARSNCKQRAGRTGRACNGRCYRFVEKEFYDVRVRAKCAFNMQNHFDYLCLNLIVLNFFWNRL